MIYFCCDEKRRNAVAAHATLNGIEFLEVSDDHSDPVEKRQRNLFVHCIKDLTSGAYSVENVKIEGGDRLRHIVVTNVTIAPGGESKVLLVEVEQPGDFSTYILRLVDKVHSDLPPDGFDPILSAVEFSFKVACQSDFDCRIETPCPPEPLSLPQINYLAKDYASFRRLMIDRMSAVMPDWQERNTADFGIAAVEMLAYVGDYLSYQQDAVATEAYLGTARRRVSVRRHARLVDYHMHDGSNARVWVHLSVESDNVKLPRRTRILTRVAGLPLRIAPPPDSALHDEALNAQPVVFETLHESILFIAHNEIEFYTWGDERCCLPKGTTHATLKNEGDRLKNLAIGDVLVFVEARNPQNGSTAEANPAHRHAVRLVDIKPASDPLFTEADDNSQALRVLNVQWATADALPFSLCLWEVDVDGDPGNRQSASIALGNIVLADHGLTVDQESIGTFPSANPILNKVKHHHGNSCGELPTVQTPPRFNPILKHKPITHAAPYDPQNPPSSAHEAMHRATSELLPDITLESNLNGIIAHWHPLRDLLNSGPENREFVVEAENDGSAALRFGDDLFGLRPAAGTAFAATYRIGNGVQGNIGADALGHIVSAEPAISGVSNPLAAHGGAEPETFEQVRQRAPVAFRTQQRAVNARDYAEVAERHNGVQRAAATFRWTGSWRTVFLTVDRLGGAEVDKDFKDEMRRHLERYRMAGHDVEIDGPIYVALEIGMRICVKSDSFRSHVKAALLEIFSNHLSPDGRRAVFHPDHFTFGQPVYLSRLYSAAQSIEGVNSVEITKFQRRGERSTKALNSGKLDLERLEIARLDNDPNFPERGVFRLTLKGGR